MVQVEVVLAVADCGDGCGVSPTPCQTPVPVDRLRPQLVTCEAFGGISRTNRRELWALGKEGGRWSVESRGAVVKEYNRDRGSEWSRLQTKDKSSTVGENVERRTLRGADPLSY